MVQTQKPLIHKWCKLGAHLFRPGAELQLHRRLHLHVVLEEAATERDLVVGLPRRGLDGRLHPGLRHGGGDDPDTPHSCVVVLPVRHRVRLLRAKPGAKRTVFGPDATRKHQLEVLQCVAAHGIEPLDFRHAQGNGSVHVVRYACRYELRAPMMGLNGSLTDDGPERVALTGR
jgi:hypothetical protein